MKPWKLLQYDPYLQGFSQDVDLRMEHYRQTLSRILPKDGALTDFANGHRYFGFHKEKDRWIYREWAPGADAMFCAEKMSGNDGMEIFVKGNEDRILLLARYDNLGKGASGAAVECMNILMGIDPKTGLSL